MSRKGVRFLLMVALAITLASCADKSVNTRASGNQDKQGVLMKLKLPF